jgi:hypothetical protein
MVKKIATWTGLAFIAVLILKTCASNPTGAGESIRSGWDSFWTFWDALLGW